MQTKAIFVTVSIFLLLVLGMFIFAHLKSQELDSALDESSTQMPVPTSSPYDYITRIDAVHFYLDGKHTLVGEIPLPTLCDLLEYEAAVVDKSIKIDFSVINNADTCAQVVTKQRFRIDVTAAPEVPIKARFMGRPVELVLTDALPGETPDDFEIFIKG